MGAAVGAVELPTAFPCFGAIAVVVSSRLGLARELLLVAVYDVCFVLPLFGIIFVLTVGGKGATERLAWIRTQFRAHRPALASGAALVAGAYVTVLGVTGLASGASGRTGRVSRRIRHVISR
jgi:cytochrome c biogenesis protein CcdA